MGPYVEPTTKVENVQATADIGRPVDLDAVIHALPGTRYNTSRFPCVVVKIAEPKSCILLFRTGKMVCTGVTSAPDVIKSVDVMMDKLRSHRIAVVDSPSVHIKNVVATANLHGKIHIEDAARRLPRSMYEPELFPGVIHRMLDPRVAVLLFASGKVVCAGAPSEEAARRAVHVVRSALVERGLISYDLDG